MYLHGPFAPHRFLADPCLAPPPVPGNHEDKVTKTKAPTRRAAKAPSVATAAPAASRPVAAPRAKAPAPVEDAARSGRFPTLTEVPRVHAFEGVFEQLAKAILRGELVEGEVLPAERILSERFGVSRNVVRQAVHKLADVGLVRVRQGGATTVLDPMETSDLRVTELRYRMAPQTAEERRDISERRMLQGYALVYLAALRAPREGLEAIGRVVDAYVEQGAPEEGITAFERDVWLGLAKLVGNRLYATEVRWWFRLADESQASPSPLLAAPARAAFYRELFRRLLAGDAAARFYMEVLGPLLGTGAPI